MSTVRMSAHDDHVRAESCCGFHNRVGYVTDCHRGPGIDLFFLCQAPREALDVAPGASYGFRLPRGIDVLA